jgi:hypothetical protein
MPIDKTNKLAMNNEFIFPKLDLYLIKFNKSDWDQFQEYCKLFMIKCWSKKKMLKLLKLLRIQNCENI